MNFFVKIRLVIRLEFVFKTMFNTIFKTMFKTMIETMFKTMIENLKNITNKNMSFAKMTDPKKRDFIVNEFLKTRQNIQHNFLSERVGDLSTQYELSEFFKPVTDMQKDLKEGLVSELKTIREGMKNLPRAITFPQFPSIRRSGRVHMRYCRPILAKVCFCVWHRQDISIAG